MYSCYQAQRVSGNAVFAAQIGSLDLNAAANGAALASGSANLSGGASGALAAAGEDVASGAAVVSVTVGLQATGGGQSNGTADAVVTAIVPSAMSAAGGAQSSGAASLLADVMITADGFGQTTSFVIDDLPPVPGLPKYTVIAPHRNYTLRGKNGLFDSKDPTEIITLTFDFSDLAYKLTSAVVACAIDAGLPDPVPAAVLVGNPGIIGCNVVQRIQGGQHGTSYQFTCTANSLGGDRFVLIGTLFVRHARVNNQ